MDGIVHLGTLLEPVGVSRLDFFHNPRALYPSRIWSSSGNFIILSYTFIFHVYTSTSILIGTLSKHRFLFGAWIKLSFSRRKKKKVNGSDERTPWNHGAFFGFAPWFWNVASWHIFYFGSCAAVVLHRSLSHLLWHRWRHECGSCKDGYGSGPRIRQHGAELCGLFLTDIVWDDIIALQITLPFNLWTAKRFEKSSGKFMLRKRSLNPYSWERVPVFWCYERIVSAKCQSEDEGHTARCLKCTLRALQLAGSCKLSCV